MSDNATRVLPRKPRYRRFSAEVRKQQLVDAAIACLAEEGLAGFTIDRICAKAGISRGLISHHFDGKEALLAAAYEAMTAFLEERTSAGLGEAGADPVAALLRAIDIPFETDVVRQPTLKAWLAVWDETAVNDDLRAIHHRRYVGYHANLAEAIAAVARERGRDVDAKQLATMLIALIDGLWLEWCLDQTLLSRDEAKATCRALLEQSLGPL